MRHQDAAIYFANRYVAAAAALAGENVDPAEVTW
jgi:homoaconitase/3-isopropylmalate dehydratase large subunit